MVKRLPYKLLSVVVSVFVLIFFSIQSVFASALFTLVPHASSQYALNMGAGNYTIKSAWRYIPTSTVNLCYVTLPMTRFGTPTGDMIVSLYSGGTSGDNGTFLTNVIQDISAVSASPTYSNRVFTFSSCQTMTGGSTYWITFSTTIAHQGAGPTNYIAFKSTDGVTALPSGVVGYDKGQTNGWVSNGTSPGFGVYMLSNGNVSGSAELPISGTASIILPENGSSLADFDFWHVDAQYTGTGWVRITYWADLGTSFSNWKDEYFVSATDTISDQVFRKGTSLWGNILEDDKLYYAVLELYDRDENLVYTSGQVGFTITGPFVHSTEYTTSTFGYATATSTSVFDEEANCADSDTGFWAGLGCQIKKAFFYVGQFLFKPSDTSQSYIQEQYSSFKSVFPFNLFYSLTGGVRNTFAQYGSSTQTLSWAVAFPTTGSNTITPLSLSTVSTSIEVLSPTTLLDHGFVTPILNWWYNIIIMLAWVGAAWGIWKVVT